MFEQTDADLYRAGLVVIGNEILTGRTQDINTQYIAEKLMARGVVLSEVRVVPDIEDKIVEAVNALRRQFDYVFTTGGIGPTHDDITAASIAKAFGVDIATHKDAYKMLEDHYGAEGLTSERQKMAMTPVGASLIPNPVSVAPGFIIENVYVMAGVPRIMQAMLDHVLPALAEGQSVLSNTIACNLPESALAGPLGEIQAQYNALEIGSYPHFKEGRLGVSVVLRGLDSVPLKAATKELVEQINSRAGEALPVHLDVPF